MKIVGLITEYNPFHNGHLYHIEKALEVTGADTAIVVMSGNYVQRGAPAIMPQASARGSCPGSRRPSGSGTSGMLCLRKRRIFCRRSGFPAGTAWMY